MGDNLSNQMKSELGVKPLDYNAHQAEMWRGGEGWIVRNFYPGTIIPLKEKQLVTEMGQFSNDGGRSWSRPAPFIDESGNFAHAVGLLRLSSGEVGCYYQLTNSPDYAFGNEESDICYRWSSDECTSLSAEVKIVSGGGNFTMPGAMIELANGRLLISAYSLFITNGELLGASWGSYKGHQIKVESEGHYGGQAASRIYFSDDGGRNWKHGDA